MTYSKIKNGFCSRSGAAITKDNIRWRIPFSDNFFPLFKSACMFLARSYTDAPSYPLACSYFQGLAWYRLSCEVGPPDSARIEDFETLEVFCSLGTRLQGRSRPRGPSSLSGREHGDPGNRIVGWMIGGRTPVEVRMRPCMNHLTIETHDCSQFSAS